MKKQLSLIFAISCTFLAFYSQAAEVKIFDRIVAVVDDDVILHTELERSLDGFKKQLSASGSQLPDDKVFREQVLERLITDNLQLQMAKRAGVRISDAELNATMTKIATGSKMSIENFKIQLEKEGDNYTLFREKIREEIMVSRVRQGQVGRRIFISEQEVDGLVQLMEEQGQTNTQYHLGHILIGIPEASDPQKISEAREKADSIVKRLRANANFAKIAVAESDGQNALSGGDFGWKNITELPTLFAGTAKSLKVNDVSEPLRSASGLHILKLLDIKGVEEQKLVAQVNARHILIKPSKIISEQQAKDLLNEIREKCINGEDFEVFAKKHSDDIGSGSLGGNLDWADPGIYAPKFKEMLAKIEENEISKPFRTQFGWHIVELLGTRISDETVTARRDNARRILFSRKFDEEVLNWLREIRAEAYVKIL